MGQRVCGLGHRFPGGTLEGSCSWDKDPKGSVPLGGLGNRGWISRWPWSLPRPSDTGAEEGCTGASPAARNPVLRRPPVLEDYINVTSTGGDRAFLVLRDDPVGTGVQVGSVQPQAGACTAYPESDHEDPSGGPPGLWSLGDAWEP